MRVFWQIKIVCVLLLWAHVMPVSANNESIAALKEAIHAYTEAKNLDHKADTFLHAQRAYNIGRKLYANAPAKQAPIIFSYANAAAVYKEPIALQIYEQALDHYVRAYGVRHLELIHPLINAADEAIYRKDPDMAYAWLARARDLLHNEKLTDSFLAARMHMGLARLFQSSGQLGRAADHASKSLARFTNSKSENAFPDNANLYFWHGQIMRSLKHNDEARDSYLNALNLFEKQEPSARKILSIHTHLVEINHKLDDPDALIFHCKAAALYQNKRSMGIWFSLYDPSGRLDPVHEGKRSAQTGEIVASYTQTANCRLRDIEILGTSGISKVEAAQVLSRAYFAPQYRDNKIIERRTDQSILTIFGTGPSASSH